MADQKVASRQSVRVRVQRTSLHSLTMSVIIIIIAAVALLPCAVRAQEEAYQAALDARANKDWNSQLKYSKQVVADYQDWFAGHYLEGEAYYKLKRYDNAIRSLTRALDYAENGGESFQAKYYIAKSYYDKGDYPNALRFIESAERHSNEADFKRAADAIAGMKGYCYFNTGKYREAIAAFKPLVDSKQASPDTLRAVGKAYQELGQNKQAIGIIAEVVRKDPKDRDAHYILIKSYYNDNDWQKVVSSVDQALANLPNEWEALYFRAYAQREMKQYNAAESTVRRSLSISKQDRSRKLLGDILAAQGKYREAAIEYENAQNGYGDSFSFYQTWAYYWIQFVPNDTQNYKGKSQENAYRTALTNAEEILKIAAGVKGAKRETLSGFREVIANKLDRLEKGPTYKEEWIISIDPKTGNIVKTKVESDK